MEKNNIVVGISILIVVVYKPNVLSDRIHRVLPGTQVLTSDTSIVANISQKKREYVANFTYIKMHNYSDVSCWMLIFSMVHYSLLYAICQNNISLLKIEGRMTFVNLFNRTISIN